jgi:hypothetical protein
MIELPSPQMLGVSNQSSLSSLESLSRAQSFENRARVTDLQHISEVLARISATLDRHQLGIISEQGGGISPKQSPENQKQSPLLVTTSYPEGGVAQAERSVVLTQKGTIQHRS